MSIKNGEWWTSLKQTTTTGDFKTTCLWSIQKSSKCDPDLESYGNDTTMLYFNPTRFIGSVYNEHTQQSWILTANQKQIQFGPVTIENFHENSNSDIDIYEKKLIKNGLEFEFIVRSS